MTTYWHRGWLATIKLLNSIKGSTFGHENGGYHLMPNLLALEVLLFQGSVCMELPIAVVL